MKTDGSSALTITPRVLGLGLFIRAEFADGSYDGMQATFNVSVDPKTVSDFMIHPNHFTKLVTVMAGGHGNAFGLYPSLTVRGWITPYWSASLQVSALSCRMLIRQPLTVTGWPPYITPVIR
jgi:hypothetical protein